MSTQIHPTAIIDPAAKIGADVTIGPFCVIGANVVLGDRVVLKSHVVVEGHTSIGADTIVYPFAVLGTDPQDLKFHGELSRLEIGERNKIREHVTMNPGTESGGMLTKVGNNGLFMVGVHIAHDCQIGNHVIMANNATLGGHVVVGNHVVIGGLAAVHQFIRIGNFAVIGGMSGIDNDVIPFGRVKGERAHLAGLNLVGLERNGFDKPQIRDIQKAVDSLFDGDGTFDERLERLAQEHGDTSSIQDIISFARGRSRFPLCAPAKVNAKAA